MPKAGGFSEVPKLNADERFDRAVREIAQARLDGAFTFIYFAIFGSQIELLKKIRANVSLTRVNVEEYFRAIQAEHEVHIDRTLDDYLRFLFGKLLIEEKEHVLSLTPLGHDFILFLYRFNLSENRPF